MSPSKIQFSAELSEVEIQRRARKLVAGMVDLSSIDALMIIQQMQSVIIQENLAINLPAASEVLPFNPILRRRGQVSKIDADPEMKAFVHGLPKYASIDEITERLRVEFGEERAPSRSSVGRYLKKLSTTYRMENKSE